MFKLISLICIFCIPFLQADEQFYDVVIPCSPKDLPTLDLAIAGIKKYGKGVRRIIVVSEKQLTTKAEWFDEKLFPFTKNKIYHYIINRFAIGKKERRIIRNHVGWYFQQFLKLYSFKVIDDLCENILILDADVIFLKPVTFFSDEGETLFAIGRQYHPPYFRHAKSLIPGFERVIHGSGVTHHMLMQKEILNDLFSIVTSTHQTELWKACCNCLDRKWIRYSGMSEYEIYFSYFFKNQHVGKIRELKWKNISDLKLLEKEIQNAKSIDFLTSHSFTRKKIWKPRAGMNNRRHRR